MSANQPIGQPYIAIPLNWPGTDAAWRELPAAARTMWIDANPDWESMTEAEINEWIARDEARAFAHNDFEI